MKGAACWVGGLAYVAGRGVGKVEVLLLEDLLRIGRSKKLQKGGPACGPKRWFVLALVQLAFLDGGVLHACCGRTKCDNLVSPDKRRAVCM